MSPVAILTKESIGKHLRLNKYLVYVQDSDEIQFFSQILFTKLFLGSGSRFHYEILNQKVMLYIYKVPAELDVLPQSFCHNQNPDPDFTLDFNTRLHFIHRRHLLNFLLPKLLCLRMGRTDSEMENRFCML